MRKSTNNTCKQKLADLEAWLNHPNTTTLALCDALEHWDNKVDSILDLGPAELQPWKFYKRMLRLLNKRNKIIDDKLHTALMLDSSLADVEPEFDLAFDASRNQTELQRWNLHKHMLALPNKRNNTMNDELLAALGLDAALDQVSQKLNLTDQAIENSTGLQRWKFKKHALKLNHKAKEIEDGLFREEQFQSMSESINGASKSDNLLLRFPGTGMSSIDFKEAIKNLATTTSASLSEITKQKKTDKTGQSSYDFDGPGSGALENYQPFSQKYPDANTGNYDKDAADEIGSTYALNSMQNNIHVALSLLDKLKESDKLPKRLVLLGHSRGAATAVWLANEIFRQFGDQIDLHMVLSDPVTGPGHREKADFTVIPPNVKSLVVSYSNEQNPFYLPQEFIYNPSNTAVTTFGLKGGHNSIEYAKAAISAIGTIAQEMMEPTKRPVSVHLTDDYITSKQGYGAGIRAHLLLNQQSVPADATEEIKTLHKNLKGRVYNAPDQVSSKSYTTKKWAPQTSTTKKRTRYLAQMMQDGKKVKIKAMPKNLFRFGLFEILAIKNIKLAYFLTTAVLKFAVFFAEQKKPKKERNTSKRYRQFLAHVEKPTSLLAYELNNVSKKIQKARQKKTDKTKQKQLENRCRPLLEQLKQKADRGDKKAITALKHYFGKRSIAASGQANFLAWQLDAALSDEIGQAILIKSLKKETLEDAKLILALLQKNGGGTEEHTKTINSFINKCRPEIENNESKGSFSSRTPLEKIELAIYIETICKLDIDIILGKEQTTKTDSPQQNENSDDQPLGWSR
jgi:hypothetical protein